MKNILFILTLMTIGIGNISTMSSLSNSNSERQLNFGNQDAFSPQRSALSAHHS